MIRAGRALPLARCLLPFARTSVWRGRMEVKLRVEPRISMNKLAEYAVTAGSLRRRSIIADQIVDRPFKRVTYEHGRRALARFFMNPASTPEQLHRVADGLRDRAGSTPKDHLAEKRSLIRSARALEAFELIADDVKSKKAVAVPGAKGGAALSWSGVRVSVRPDIGLLRPGTERRIGAIKFHFSVHGRLTPKALKYAATILRAYLIDQGETPQPSQCIAVDVMAMEYESAPRSMRTILKELQASCKEIAALWPSILAEEQENEKVRANVRLV